MTTKQEQILEAVKTALTGTTNVGNRIYRSRQEPLSREESPAIVITPGNNRASGPEGGLVDQIDWFLTVNVLVIIRGAIPDKLADPIVQSLYSKIMADTTLGNLALDIQPIGIDTQLTDSDQTAALINCSFQVQFRTAYATLT